jgi:hypothetical protein
MLREQWALIVLVYGKEHPPNTYMLLIKMWCIIIQGVLVKYATDLERLITT